MKILMCSGHGDSAVLTIASNWPHVARGCDGLHVGTPTFSYDLDNSQRNKIVSFLANTFCTVEMPWGMFASNKLHYTRAVDSGLDVKVLMLYNDDFPNSTPSRSQIAIAKEWADKQGVKLIVNCRDWSPFRVIDGKELWRIVAEDCDGVCFEFQVTTDECELRNWRRGIRWAIKMRKTVMLLTPPNHDSHVVIKRLFLKDFQGMVGHLRARLGETIIGSDYLILAPSNYDRRITLIDTGPERDHERPDGYYNANTAAGCARWAILTR